MGPLRKSRVVSCPRLRFGSYPTRTCTHSRRMFRASARLRGATSAGLQQQHVEHLCRQAADSRRPMALLHGRRPTVLLHGPSSSPSTTASPDNTSAMRAPTQRASAPSLELQSMCRCALAVKATSRCRSLARFCSARVPNRTNLPAYPQIYDLWGSRSHFPRLRLRTRFQGSLLLRPLGPRTRVATRRSTVNR